MQDNTRPLGPNGTVRIPHYGLGTGPLGNLFAAVTEDFANATVQTALDSGWTYFDTAPHYGVGLAEERLGRALQGVPRDSYVLSSKVGRVLEPLPAGETPDSRGIVDTLPRRRRWDFSRDGVLRSIEDSLHRLNLDRLDIVYLHDADDPAHRRAVYEQAYPALAELRAQGVVGAIGAGMNRVPPLEAFVGDLDLDVILLAGRYTLLDQEAADKLLDLCTRRNTSVVVRGVFNSGLLVDPRPDSTFDHTAAPPETVERAHRAAAICESGGVALRTAALRFPFGHPAVACVLVSCRSAAEVQENAAAAAVPVPDELWAELRAEGIVTAAGPAA
jgi:D-threo-aldose 1-dehydrogenase